MNEINLSQKNTDQALIEKLQRRLPVNKEAEQMLLGAILINDKSLEYVDEFLKSEHFYEILHQKIYRAMQTIKTKELSCNLITVKSMLSGDLLYQENGGDEYLYKLTTIAMTVINVAEYGRIIYDAFLKRSLIDIGEEVVNNVYDSTISESAMEQLERAEEKMYHLASEGFRGKSFVQISDPVKNSIANINRAMKNQGKLLGISTGLHDMDKILAGFHDSDLVIIAGRPAMGKTAFAVNFAYNACLDLLKKAKETNAPPKSVGFFSLEMSSEQLVMRLLSMMTKINSKQFQEGSIQEEDYNKLSSAAMELSQIPFFIDDSPALSIASVRARARKLKRKHNLGILFIDYLQLMRSSTARENRVLEVTEITQGLKAIAKELNIPVIALAQLSRAVETRTEKRPILSDLRESGSIEQDADIVMFLYREEYYLANQVPSDSDQIKYQEWQSKLENVHNMAEIIIAKHRNGKVGSVKAYYETQFSTIKDYISNNEIEKKLNISS